MIIYVHNEESGQIEKYTRCLDEAMPYTTGKNLTVRDFRGDIRTQVMWTTKRFLTDFDQVFDRCDFPFEVERGFHRGWQEVDNGRYVHKLGTALQGGRNLSYPVRVKLARLLEDSERFDGISEMDHDPTSLHFYQAEAAQSDVVPFKTIQMNDVGTPVFVLQDCLWALGYSICALNGIFDEELAAIVKQFQTDQGLEADGIVSQLTWERLMSLIHPDDLRLEAPID